MEEYITNAGSGCFQPKIARSIIGSLSGLIFGYNIGISGGVAVMNDFLMKFFPEIHGKLLNKGGENKHCNYNDKFFQLFTSSLFVAAALSSMVALISYKKLGRKRTMWVAALFYIVGVVLQASATNLSMLILGRTCVGVGVGFTNQVVPLFISVTKYNMVGMHLFQKQVVITVGILIANLVNQYAYKIQPYGWRISLGGSAVPAFFVVIASIFITNDDVYQKKTSYQDIVHVFMKSRSSWPHMFCATMIQVFKQFTGISAIVLYFPLIFETITGYNGDVSLLQTVTIGVVIVFSTVYGARLFVYELEARDARWLFHAGRILMLISQLGILVLPQHPILGIPELHVLASLRYVHMFVAAFSSSWGTLGWLITSETIQAVDNETTRSAISLVAVISYFVSASFIAQISLTMWCHINGWIFFFFLLAWIAWTVVMTEFACDYLPEIKRIAKLEDETNPRVWREHWFWKRFYDQGYNAKQPKGVKKKKKKTKKRD